MCRWCACFSKFDGATCFFFLIFYSCGDILPSEDRKKRCLGNFLERKSELKIKFRSRRHNFFFFETLFFLFILDADTFRLKLFSCFFLGTRIFFWFSKKTTHKKIPPAVGKKKVEILRRWYGLRSRDTHLLILWGKDFIKKKKKKKGGKKSPKIYLIAKLSDV